MKTIRINHLVVMLILLAGFSQQTLGQSPDSRICNCFSDAVSSDFMQGTKALYGRIGLFVSRNTELTPNASQTVKFIVPKLPLKPSCQAQYSLYIVDETNRVMHEQYYTLPEISYTFSDCTKTYTVQIGATGKSAGGRDGNCSRLILFKVKPVCR
ncbi:MAG: hypothetical protein U0Y10_02430 [Spirosomataceae bacterium]